MRRCAVYLGLMMALGGNTPVVAAPHPHYDDGGAVNWKPNWAAALQAAKATGKPIFIDASIENWGPCQQLVSSTLRDPKISQIIKRHFVPVAFDANSAPPEVKAAFARTGGERLPYVLYLNDKGQLIHGTSGGKSVEELHGDLDKALNDKSLALSKKGEADLVKLVDTLEKQVSEKKLKEAVATFNNIQKFRGYSATKDKAFDLMDKAQDDGLKSLEQALAYAGRDDYDKGKDLLEKVQKDFPGMPVADQAKEHLNALKALENASQPMKDMKGNWQPIALQRLANVIRSYPETPYASLANQRQRELLKGK